LKKFSADLEPPQSNVLDMMVDGVDSLMAYSDIDERGTALALIVPKEDVMVEALADVTFEAQRDIMDEGNRAIKLSLVLSYISIHIYT
jgi:hypothetical protein